MRNYFMVMRNYFMVMRHCLGDLFKLITVSRIGYVELSISGTVLRIGHADRFVDLLQDRSSLAELMHCWDWYTELLRDRYMTDTGALDYFR